MTRLSVAAAVFKIYNFQCKFLEAKKKVVVQNFTEVPEVCTQHESCTSRCALPARKITRHHSRNHRLYNKNFPLNPTFFTNFHDLVWLVKSIVDHDFHASLSRCKVQPYSTSNTPLDKRNAKSGRKENQKSIFM